MAALSSSAQASSYYGKDNYYTRDDNEAASQWFGQGAETLGLEGAVNAETFEQVLAGHLPDGSIVGEGSNREHRPGFDLTFSAPKSLSIMALAGGDDRLVRAHMEAVKQTLKWAEANFAEARIRNGDRLEVVKTGNLVVGLFAHDTSRSLDPQMHVHAPIANATQTEDGKWRALHNDKLWANNTLMGAVYHNWLRELAEKLGYRTYSTGKHGTFELQGFNRDQIEHFSQRHNDILAKGEELGISTPQGYRAIAARTRDRKLGVDDRDQLYGYWAERAASVGLDLPAILHQSEQRASRGDIGPSINSPAYALARNLREKVEAVGAYFRDLVGGRNPDPYYVRPGILPPPREMAAAQAVASAIHHLSERETSFSKYEIAASALHLGLPTTIDRVERQIVRLADKQILHRGVDGVSFTTASGIAMERSIISEATSGLGASSPILADKLEAGQRLQASAQALKGMTLNPQQESAGRHLLTSSDRIINIQGAAGVGKSTILQPSAHIMREQGINVLGLAVAHRVVNDLRKDAGIEATTVAKFIATHRSLLQPNVNPDRIELAREMFKDTVLLVDESSMLSNEQALKLSRIANLTGLKTLAYIGDKRQLGAVEAGKPFELSQKAGTPTVEVAKNVRAKTADLLKAANLANSGKIVAALQSLSKHTISVGDQVAEIASQKWLALAPDIRAKTVLMTSGRMLMEQVNEIVQDGLRAEGVISGPGHQIRILDKVNPTQAELQSPATYEAGMRIEFTQFLRRHHSNAIRPGTGVVSAVDREKETISIKLDTGKSITLFPRKLPRDKNEASIRLDKERNITIHKGDQLRWTGSDAQRHIYNKDITTVLGIDAKGIRVTNNAGVEMTLPFDDPMLKRVDLAYALNTHQLQGASPDNVIAAASSRETNLANARNFLVNITRPREGILLVLDDAGKYETRIGINPGNKESALETIGEKFPVPSADRGEVLAAQTKLPPERNIDISNAGGSKNRDFDR